MMLTEDVRKKMEQIVPSENLKYQEPMKRHTTFRIGGEAECFVAVENTNQLKELLKLLRAEKVPYYIVGNGSNLLFADEGFSGVILNIAGKMQKIACNGNKIVAQAGALMAQIARVARENGLTGFEFAGGIPGTIGGGVVMNAGAYGGELCQVITKVTMLTEDGEEIALPVDAMEFGYRTSILKKKPYIVTEVEIALTEGDKETIASTMEELQNKRKEKQPLEYPSAGSTFKRPEGYFAAALIEQAGLKGYRVGDAQVSEKHSGFVVNVGEASCKDVQTLMADVQNKVWEQFQVKLEPEVICVK